MQWLESGGAQVAVIPYDAAALELDALLRSVDGVLFTGGGLSLGLNTTYDRTAMRIFEHVQTANAGRPPSDPAIALWGTCMGFQLLNVLAARSRSVLTSGVFDSEGLNLPLQLTDAGRASRFYSGMPPPVRAIFTEQNVTVNLHHDGVTPDTIARTPALSQFYTVVSTNRDRKGQAFASTIEAKRFPIYGVQWHPERPQFEWTTDRRIAHSAAAVEANSWTARFFVEQARHSPNAFANATAEHDALIYTHKLISPRSDSYGWYLFGPRGGRVQ